MRTYLAAVLFALAMMPAAAQWLDYKEKGVPRLPDGKANLSAPAPKTADGKPDLTGIWRSGGTRTRYDYDVAQHLSPEDLQPWGEALRLERVQEFRKDSPLAHCLPVSLPFLNNRGLARFVQTSGLIVVLHESPNSPHRTIFLDGRPLPKDPNPTWLGYSTGRWEGDTLVVETEGFNDRGWLDVGGHPQTESLHMTERFRRRDFGHMDVEMTLTDPKVFKKPVVMKMEHTLVPDTDLIEDVCENERDAAKLSGGVKLGAETLAKYAGTYEYSPGREVVVTFSGEVLWAQEGKAARVAFVPRSETSFLASTINDAIEFVKDGQGNFTKLIWRRGANEETAVRKK